MRGRGRLNLVTAIDRARRLAAPRTCASGIRTLEAGTSILTGCGCWLHREDFTSRFILTGTSVSDGTAMASIGWEAAITAFDAGPAAMRWWGTPRPAAGREHRRGIPVGLYDTLPGLDYHTSAIVIKAIMRATGQTQAWTNESRPPFQSQGLAQLPRWQARVVRHICMAEPGRITAHFAALVAAGQGRLKHCASDLLCQESWCRLPCRIRRHASRNFRTSAPRRRAPAAAPSLLLPRSFGLAPAAGWRRADAGR